MNKTVVHPGITLGFLIWFTLFFSQSIAAKNELRINVKEYGLKGDGKTNDYFALKEVFQKINENQGGEIFFPSGEYYLGVHNTIDNKVGDLLLLNCDGVTIKGENAIISVKGDFHRGITRRSSKNVFSNIHAITPMIINNCRNVKIENLEIRGNVQKTTRDEKVVESNGRLIYIVESEDVTIKNVSLHHAQTDGIGITGNKKPSRNISLINVKSYNNARMAMTIGGLVNGRFENCEFMNSGITEGQYGNHGPSAGVDIEPNTVKHVVRDVLFKNCIFSNNLGSQFIASHTATTKNITLENCNFIANEKSHKYTIIVNAKNVVFKNANFDCKNGQIYPVWQQEGSSSVFDGCTIKSNTNAFIAVSQKETNTVKINNCTLEYTGNKVLGSYFPYIRMKNMTFTNNKIIIPSQFYRPKRAVALIESAQLVSRNNFYSQGQIVKPYVSYKGSNVVE